MADSFPQPTVEILDALRQGLVIPAHPLALTAARKLDERRQVALSRYYLSAGAGGLAVAVHTTQFAIREPKHDLLRPVLELAAGTVREDGWANQNIRRPIVLIAGICGPTIQAVGEAALASSLGYHAGLLSLAALPNSCEEELLTHAQRVAQEIPLIGFYLQPSVGGRVLTYDFWRRFCEIPNVLAIKVAPFNRYQTFDVVRAVASSGRADSIALYTGNDDSIVIDLLSKYRIAIADSQIEMSFDGGLLGHWACWTRTAVQLQNRIAQARKDNYPSSETAELLSTAHKVTDMNAAIFDAANNYRGCIAGVHEVLRRQGLMAGIWCLDPEEQMSPRQGNEITRVSQSYPELVDDEFVLENRATWLA